MNSMKTIGALRGACLLATTAAGRDLTGRSTLGDWENSTGQEQYALAEGMLAATKHSTLGKVVVDLEFCIEKAAGKSCQCRPYDFQHRIGLPCFVRCRVSQLRKRSLPIRGSYRK